MNLYYIRTYIMRIVQFRVTEYENSNKVVQSAWYVFVMYFSYRYIPTSVRNPVYHKTPIKTMIQLLPFQRIVEHHLAKSIGGKCINYFTGHTGQSKMKLCMLNINNKHELQTVSK